MRKEARRRNISPLQKDIAKAYRRSGLTQREFATRLPLNPRTGKPYNDRTIRKWIGAERSTRNLEVTLQQNYAPMAGTQTFLQIFKVNGQERSFRLRTRRGQTILQMLTDLDSEARRKRQIAQIYRDPKKTDSEPMTVDEDDIELETIDRAARISNHQTYSLSYE